MNNSKNPISLYAEATPNPNVMKFTANKILIEKKSNDLPYLNFNKHFC